MKRRPRIFLFISFIFFLIAISFYFQIAWQSDTSLWDIQNNLRMMTILNWALVILLLANALLAFRISVFLKITLPLLVVCLIYNNYLVASYSDRAISIGATFSSLIFTVSLAFVLIHKQNWKFLTKDGPRWWVGPPRHLRNLPVVVHSRSVKNMKAKTFDLSMNGAFLCSLDDSWNVKLEDDLIVSIAALGFECKAKVKRITFGKGQYPEGVGIEFISPSEHARNLLKYFIHGRPENLLSDSGPL